MVENSINTIKVEKVISCAKRGFKAIKNAVPVQPLPTEPFPILNWEQLIVKEPEIY
jgi:hypothetical protein